MRRANLRPACAAGFLLACGLISVAWAQDSAAPSNPSQVPAATQSSAATVPSAPTPAGGKLHGVVKSGNIPLPGVTVTATNTLTGKRYATTTDITGTWSLTIPQNGRYVVRTQFAAFAQGSQEALLNAANREQTLTFELILTSRAAQQEQQQNAQGSQAAEAIRQLAGSGLQSLSLMSAQSEGTETQGGAQSAASAGASLPSAAGNADFGGDSVAISGQSGSVSPLAGVDMDRLRDAMETFRAQNPGQNGPGNSLFSGLGDGGFGGGFGGPGGFGGGGGRGGRMNFRNFKPGQPHGALFWTGSNSSLNAEPFSLRGQEQLQPASGTNRFGATLITAPYIPRLTKPSGKDTLFFTLSGQRSSNPQDIYAIVPTEEERAGNFSAMGLPAIFNHISHQQYASNGLTNVIPAFQIAPPAKSLLSYYPEPNLSGSSDGFNYHLLTTAQTNSTRAGIRYMRGIGSNATPFGMGGRGGSGGGSGGGGRRSQSQGLRQSVNFNYNWSNSDADVVSFIPQLGGKTRSNSNSVQAGYTIGYHRVTNIFNASWNRSDARTTNLYTGLEDIATELGILGPNGTALNSSPLNYGLPSLTMSGFTGLSETEPGFTLTQTISASETLSWIHGKHNLRFGGDYRRIHRDLLSGSNATGSFTFSGLFTEDSNGSPATGFSLADLELGLPQASAIDSMSTKAYLRGNVVDAFAQDDWRVLPSLTLMYGVRYEYYSPYWEKYGRIAFVDTNPQGGFTSETEVQAGGAGPFSGALPHTLVYPFHKAFAPRLGIALRLPMQTVLRAGFGMNYTVGEYASFGSSMAHEPPFANEQTNQEAIGNTASPQCAHRSPATCFTLSSGFPVPASVGNYAIDPHYPLPYVQAWNIDVQKTLPWGIVMNVGYNGSKGNHLDMRSAPRATPNSPGTDPLNLLFTYDQAEAFSKMSAGTVRVNKRLSSGFAVGANYQYSHAIDDAGAVNGVSQVVAQNWQDLQAEEGNSSFDVRHSVSGTYLYELPFGKDKVWVTSGAASHLLEGLSISGSYTFSTGFPLTPSYEAAVASVACGTAGALRPNRVPGTSATAGGGTLRSWFNPAAFTLPQGTPGFCNAFGNASRNSIAGPGTLTNAMSLSKTLQLGDTRSMEIRASLNNAFNTVQYSGVGTVEDLPTFGQVTSVAPMRSFQFQARFRF